GCSCHAHPRERPSPPPPRTRSARCCAASARGRDDDRAAVVQTGTSAAGARSVTGSAVEAVGPVAGLAGLMRVGEDEDLTGADRKDEAVRELAQVPAADHRLSVSPAIRRRRVRPAQDQLGGRLDGVDELVAQRTVLDFRVMVIGIQELCTGLWVVTPLTGHLRRAAARARAIAIV